MTDRDVVIPFLDTGTEELRYCLRSIAMNVPHRNIYIVGDPPPEGIKDVVWVKVSQGPNKYMNVRRNWLSVPPNVTDAYLFNDDFFVMTKDPITPRHIGTLPSGHLARVALRKTGCKTWLNFADHSPLPVFWPHFADEIANLPDPMLRHMRTWYGNKAGLAKDSTKAHDCKIVGDRQVARLGLRQFISTSEMSWPGHAGRYVREVFSEPCRYER